jgi:hypothetical protein
MVNIFSVHNLYSAIIKSYAVDESSEHYHFADIHLHTFH